MNPKIRPELPSDAPAVHDVTVRAFKQAPHSDQTEYKIVEELRNADAMSVSLVAEVEGNIVGHVVVSPVSLSDGSTGWHGLGPISVLPFFQGQGIGSQLIRGALSHLREQESSGCVLLGDPAYYARFGFKPEPGLVLPGVPPEYFQALLFGSTMPSGTVEYHRAFNAGAS